MIHTPFLFVLGLVVAGCSPEALADSTSTRNQVDPLSEAKPKPATQERVVIPVEGMACESCAGRLQHRLAKIDGVSSATVDFAKKEARVTFNPKRVSVKKIVEEIDKTFEAGKPREADET
jgi:copper chaperone CopZ